MRARWTEARLLLLLPCFVWLLAGVAWAQVEEDLGLAALQSRRVLQEAQSYYDQAEFALAIQALDTLLAELGPSSGSALAVEEEEVQLQAHRLRGLAYFNLGQVDAARSDFEFLLRRQPDLELETTLLSPKIVEAFEDVRDSVSGTLAVQTEPPGAEVRFGSRVLGVTPLEGVRVVNGRYLLDVEKRGFTGLQEPLEIEAGVVVEKTYALQRNARSVTVMTSPPGAEVYVDDAWVATTAGTAPAGQELALMTRGLRPEDVSAPTVLPFLTAGPHIIRVEKNCYAPVEADFSVTLEGGDLPLELEIIALEPSRSALSLTSTPPGAQAWVNGRIVGTTPVRAVDLCGGEAQVAMAMADVGIWEGQVSLTPERESAVHGELKLALANLGAVREIGLESARVSAWDRFLAEVLAGQTSYAAVSPPLTADEITPSHLELFRRVQSHAAHAPPAGEDLRRRLAREIKADLMLLGVPGAGDGGVLLLYGLDREQPDLIPVTGLSLDEVNRVGRLLALNSLSRRTWSGLHLLETAESDFPLIVERTSHVDPGTTLRPGDRVRSVAGQPVVSRREFVEVVSGLSPGKRVDVLVDRSAGMVEAYMVPIATPVFRKGTAEAMPVNKVLADLKRVRLTADDERERSLASLGMGMAYLAAGEPERALTQGFQRCRLEKGAGISAGTVSYLTGISLEEMGSSRRAEAQAAFTAAAAADEATLWSDQGPRIAPLARSRLD